MNVQIIFVRLECQRISVRYGFAHDVQSGDKGRNILAGLVKAVGWSYCTDARNTTEINPSVVSLTDGCRDEPAEQHGIVGGKIGGKRVVFRIILNQFLVGIYPQMAVYVKLQLVDNISVQFAQPGMIRQFFVCTFKA